MTEPTTSLFEDTNPRALKELLADIHNRTMVLPDFQRDFVWDPAATRDLVVSIANNYPAGSILRVRDTKRVFTVRAFDGAPPLGTTRHTFLVLDGQQRLTSLYQAFFGVGEHRYFLDLGKLMEGVDFDEAILHVRATKKWAKKREDFELQAAEMLLPLSVLRGGLGTFSSWMSKVCRRFEGQQRNALEDKIVATVTPWIQAIDDYHFPVVTLSDKTEADALCTIFETLNRTGVKLTVFELLTARFWSDEINLRQLWDDTKQKHPSVEHFDVDPYYVLQAISLASRKTPSCKRSDVLGMTAMNIREWWPRVVDGLAEGIEMLRDDCGVMLPRWLPYQTIFPPLAAILARSGTLKAAASGARRAKLSQWFWCVVLGQHYESAANSKSEKDVAEVCTWIDGGPPPESVSSFRFDPRALRAVTPKQRSIYRGIMCLALRAGGGARDFHTRSVITGRLMEEQGIDDHHVFPADYVNRVVKASARQRDCVLNRTLIDRTTNQRISNRAPSDYLGEMRRTSDFPFEEVLNSHCLPVAADSPLLANDFEGFLSWRQDRLWQEIQRVTGATTAVDLEEPEDAA